MHGFGIALAALCTLAVPAAAQATVVNGTQNTDIAFVDHANANPYPSNLTISGGDGPVLDVDVSLTMDPIAPDDLDIALVGPSGAATILMSDACGGTAFSPARTFTFSQGSAVMPDGGPCPAGTYGPSNYEVGTDNWPAPGPGALSSANLNNFNGLSANGVWKLFVLDDNSLPGGTQGSITSWSLSIVTATGQIVIPAKPNTSGLSSPYPSDQTFDTPAGQVIDDLNLKINGFGHTFPRDVDMLLQGPGGENVMVMSDVCSNDDIADARNWLFDDEASLPFTDDPTSCTVSSAKPSDLETDDTMPAPAPGRPYGSTMAVFDGTPGGAFKLFVNDDAGSDTGYITSWTIQMTTRPLAAVGFDPIAVATAEGQTATLTVKRTGSANLGAASMNVTVTDAETDSRDFGHAIPTKLDFAAGETQKTISIPITADTEGEPAERFFVSLSDESGDAKLANATSIATVTIAKSAPDNSFTLGDATRKRNGTAEVPVTVPGPGQITSDDSDSKDRLKTISTFADRGGTFVVQVKPSGTTKRKLRRGKKVRLDTQITFTPDGGTANSKDAPVVLKKRRR
jgi:subtilisin-like proprotein convertase family protein